MDKLKELTPLLPPSSHTQAPLPLVSALAGRHPDIDQPQAVTADTSSIIRPAPRTICPRSPSITIISLPPNHKPNVRKINSTHHQPKQEKFKDIDLLSLSNSDIKLLQHQ